MSLLGLIASSAGAFYRATLPAGDVTAHGAGYPLTYRFTVPDQPGILAQTRAGEGQAWETLAAPPGGRFDGISVARFDGTTAYVSQAFPAGGSALDLRVIDSNGQPVGTFLDIAPSYDGRVPVAFTYDDTPWAAEEYNAATTSHQTNKVWMSPGYNMTTFNSRKLPPTLLDAGYVEPVNHTWQHLNAASFTTQTQADNEYLLNLDAMLSGLPIPAQSRGRIHSAIYPYGSHNAYVYEACRKAGHLTGRLVLDYTLPPEGGTYTRGAWDPAYGMVTQQQASVSPWPGSSTQVQIDAFDQAVGAQKVLDAVNHARTNSLEQCIVYSYTRHWKWGPTDPGPQMLAAISAMSDVWSVGYGHLALYQRTRERTTVTPA